MPEIRVEPTSPPKASRFATMPEPAKYTYSAQSTVAAAAQASRPPFTLAGVPPSTALVPERYVEAAKSLPPPVIKASLSKIHQYAML